RRAAGAGDKFERCGLSARRRGDDWHAEIIQPEREAERRITIQACRADVDALCIGQRCAVGDMRAENHCAVAYGQRAGESLAANERKRAGSAFYEVSVSKDVAVKRR